MTFLLTDIVGSTRLWETAPAAVAGALPVHHRLIEELQRAAAENPGIPAFRAVLAQAYCELDRFDDARQLFDRDAAGDFGDYVYD